ncbi:MAG: ATP-binding cassette domain-containing protein [Microbacterium sp.]|uniref:ABC transporter ATP-binding protein n=1 Tax=Microbacterium sp. TaxID=51671 RepID=UPI0039E676EE
MTELLTVRNLSMVFGRGRAANQVLTDVSFTVAAGETVALVGESGSGKTTIGRAVLGLLTPTSGEVLVDGVPVHGRRLRDRRRRVGMMQAVFQDPYSSLNPTVLVGRSIAEPLGVMTARREARTVVSDLVERVGLPPDTADRYPAHFSGGQRQRIGIARALTVRPRLIVCDEPTSALDVSTQRRILDLLRGIQEESGVGYLFITHDLAVVREFADRVVVLRRGEIVEEGPAAAVCDAPSHPYTRALVAAAPVPDPRAQRRRRIERAQLLASAGE